MAAWAPLEFIMAYLGVAGLALWFVDRSHRQAMERISAVFDQQSRQQQIVIDVLYLAVDTLRRHGNPADYSAGAALIQSIEEIRAGKIV